MNARRHAADPLIAAYGRGTMPLAAGIVLSAHLEFCRFCRERVEAVEEAEGRALSGSQPAPLAPDALAKVMARLDEQPASPQKSHDVPEALDGVRLPSAVSRLGLKPRRFIAPGLWAARVKVKSHDDWRAFIIRAPAGATIPTHGHHGAELVAVLNGGFSDSATYAEGDFVEGAAGSEHQLRISDEAPCVCLIAMQGPVHWRGWAKMISVVLGI